MSLHRKIIKEHFSKLCENGVIRETTFWSSIKPFKSNKGCRNNSNLNLLVDGVIISDELKVANTFKHFCVNIVQNICGKNNTTIPPINSSKSHESDNVIDSIIDKYKEHPSIKLIKVNLSQPNTFTFKKAPKDDIIEIIKGLDSTTATGIDTISPKSLKLYRDIIAEPLTNLIKSTLINFHLFPLRDKVATMTPVFKKDEKLLKRTYRLISVLSVLSKVFERYILNQIMPFFDKIQSKFLSAYRSRYSSQHILLRLIEEWRKCLDKNKVVGAILMDLSKAFDCLPHDLLISKLEAYG